MQRIILLLVVISFCSISIAQVNDTNPFSTNAMTSAEMVEKGYKRYQVESGTYILEYSGTENGTETVYFDRWGWREARYKSTVTKVLGMKSKSEGVAYLDGENMYQYNPENNTYTRIKNTMVKPIADNAGDKDLTDGAREVVAGMGGEKVGEESVLGYNCEKWDMGTFGLNWIHKGISLKSESKLLGVKVNIMAVEASFGIPVSEGKLQMPEGAESVYSQYGYK